MKSLRNPCRIVYSDKTIRFFFRMPTMMIIHMSCHPTKSSHASTNYKRAHASYNGIQQGNHFGLILTA